MKIFKRQNKPIKQKLEKKYSLSFSYCPTKFEKYCKLSLGCLMRVSGGHYSTRDHTHKII